MKMFIQAIDNDTFSDLEDCLQDRCAADAGVRYIVTRNVSDFENSEIPAILPEEILLKIKKDS